MNDAHLGPMPGGGARAAMERLNAEAGKLHIWLRTQANAPAQRPWFRDAGIEAGGRIAEGRVGAAQLKPAPHRWRWREIGPYLDRIAEIARAAEVSPIEFAERQQFLLTNPGLGGRLQVTSTMRCAVSIYNPGDVAPVHIHTPNASRTILSEKGGYTTIEGERCEAARGDLILTPNGTWHDHGNDGSDAGRVGRHPRFPADGVPRLRLARRGLSRHDRGQRPGAGGHPRCRLFAEALRAGRHGAGFRAASPRLRASDGADVPLPRRRYPRRARRVARRSGRSLRGDHPRFVNPATGGPVFPTLDYSAQLLRPGEATRFKRETASSLYIVHRRAGHTEIAGQRFEWETNDIFVVPGFLWRRHINKGQGDAVLYAVSDLPLLEKIGQYRAQGRLPDDTVAELVP